MQAKVLRHNKFNRLTEKSVTVQWRFSHFANGPQDASRSIRSETVILFLKEHFSLDHILGNAIQNFTC